MPKRKLSYSKRSAASKRSTWSTSRLSRGPRMSVGRVTRSAYIDLAVADGVATPYAMSYNSKGVTVNGTLYGFYGAGDLVALYDAYRISKVAIQFSYNQNGSSVSNVVHTLPYLFIANDPDDANISLGIGEIVQRDGSRMYVLGGNTPVGNAINWNCFPKIAVAAYAGAANGYMEPKAKQWVTTTGPLGFNDVQHYGTKFYTDATQMTAATGLNGTLRVFVKVYFEMKHGQ